MIGIDAQADLFGSAQQRYDDGTYPDGFWEWLAENEHIYREFVKLARQGKDRGMKTWSARSIVEVMRWQTALRQRGDDSLKINDHAVPGLARLAMAREPDLEGFFRTRTPPGKDEARKLNGERYVWELHT